MMETRDRIRAYGQHSRPKNTSLMRALRLDVVYERARGDSLFYRDARARPIEVLDMVGGYGATMLGHNPAVTAAALRSALDAEAPFVTQASVRGDAAELAERLHRRLLSDLGASYGALLANSGAEATECAIKHAELSYGRRLHAIEERLERRLAHLRGELAAERVSVSPGLLETLDLGADAAPDEVVARIRHRFGAARDALRPRFAALEGAFHGKTLGALALTASSTYRAPFERLLTPVTFIPMNDAAALARLALDHQRTLPFPEVSRGMIQLDDLPVSELVAFFAEPIQGEGGVHVMTRAFARALEGWARRESFHLVFDEIQTGVGRTGTFLFAEQLGVIPDVILISKSLGGGVTKTAAALFRREIYEPELGWLHSSTFAEDALSSRVALAVLDELEGPSRPMDRARERGRELLAALSRIQARFPSAIREVRGVGTMIGVELATPSFGGAIHALSMQGMLGYVVSAHLLHEHRVRVMPCMSSPAVLRLEPSAYLSREDAGRALDAIEHVAEILAARDAWALLRFLVGLDDAAAPPTPHPRDVVEPSPLSLDPERPRVAFIGYFVDAEQMVEWDASLGRFTREQREALIERVFRQLEPMRLSHDVIRSADGREAELVSYGLFVDSRTFHAALRGPDRRIMRDKVKRAIDLAAQDGARAAALGGLTSIITSNGRDVDHVEIAVTSGNALTVGACFDKAFFHAHAMGISVHDVTAAVVGATGNIGSVYAELLADHVGKMVLVARPGSEAALRPLASKLFLRAVRRAEAFAKAQRPPVGLAASIDLARPVDTLEAWLDRDDAPLRITSDMSALRDAQIILGASNAPHPVIEAEHLGTPKGRDPFRVLVVDVAVPGDASEDVHRLAPRVSVIGGGTIDLGATNRDVEMSPPLPPGQLYACAAEVVVLALAGRFERFTVGAIDADRVREILALARTHGFLPSADAHRSALAPLRREAESLGGGQGLEVSP